VCRLPASDSRQRDDHGYSLTKPPAVLTEQHCPNRRPSKVRKNVKDAEAMRLQVVSSRRAASGAIEGAVRTWTALSHPSPRGQFFVSLGGQFQMSFDSRRPGPVPGAKRAVRRRIAGIAAAADDPAGWLSSGSKRIVHALVLAELDPGLQPMD
jgi:hypothetical protein